MNYDQFCDVWGETLRAARLLPFAGRPRETIDLGQMSREYSTIVELGQSRAVEPFHVTATLSWHWEALHAARTVTTEEDMLRELFGPERNELDSQQPMLLVAVALAATLPWGSTNPRPPTRSWRQWMDDLTARVTPLLSVPSAAEDKRIADALFGEPEVHLRCAADGRLYLTRVELSSWQAIDLPRQWDNPTRARDPEPDAQLADFARRLREALQAWEESLRHLIPAAGRE